MCYSVAYTPCWVYANPVSSPRLCLLIFLTEITGIFPSMATWPHCGNWHIAMKFQKASRTFPEGKSRICFTQKLREQNVIWLFNCYPMKQNFQNRGKLTSNLEFCTQLTPAYKAGHIQRTVLHLSQGGRRHEIAVQCGKERDRGCS